MHHLADRVREVLRTCAIESDLGDGVLAFKRLTARFEVDVLCETLQIELAPISGLLLAAQRLDPLRRNFGPLGVSESNDGADRQHRQRQHREETEILLVADAPIEDESAPPEDG